MGWLDTTYRFDADQLSGSVDTQQPENVNILRSGQHSGHLGVLQCVPQLNPWYPSHQMSRKSLLVIITQHGLFWHALCTGWEMSPLVESDM